MQIAMLMTRTSVAALTLLVAACGGSQGPGSKSAAADGPAGKSAESAPDPRCPMLVEKVEVVASPIAYGAEFAFSTESAKVDELRRRVKLVADAYSPPELGVAAEEEELPIYWPTPAFETEAEYEESEKGARLKLTAAESGNAEALRDHVETLAEEMRRSGTCPSGVDE